MMHRIITIIILILFSHQLFAKSEEQTADYIIVGVGTSGSYLAKKLSDDMKTSVIGLQNGPNYNSEPLVKFSKYAFYIVTHGLTFQDSPLYANGYTINQTNLNNQKLHWMQALPLGGASSANGSGYCIGTNYFFSQWETIAGSKWWSVNRIQEIYRELEHYQGETLHPLTRGYFGPINIRQEAHASLVSTKFTNAIMNATHLPFVLDYNDLQTPIGVSSQLQYTQMGTDGNLRGSSSTIFLNPTVMTTDGQGVDDRKLKILFNSTAAKVIWENNKAIGVEYIQDHKINHVYARKAVIVTAGLKSSAFLLRSGVGPKNVLDSLKIPVVYNNPNVGKNLIDQPHISLFFQTNMNDTPLDDNRLKNNPNEVFSQIAWLPDPEGNSKIRAFRMVTINLEPGLATLFLDLNQEKSRGSISINSQDPFDEPVIDSGILNNPEDLSLFIRGFQTYVAAINKSFQAIDPEYKLIYPDPKIINDKKLLTEFIKQEIALTMHFQGHCKMAPLNQGGVVDSTGHVYGVQNLLVADDSVIPVPTDGSTLATAYLVAANIGRILLNDK